MWDVPTGHDYIRTMDQKNAMARHYKRLKEIKEIPNKPSHKNARFEQKLRKKSPPTRFDKELKIKVKDENTKLVKALEDISSTWGKLSPFVIDDGSTSKKKTLGFKYKSNKELIQENMRYLGKIKAVKPVYNHKEFNDERKKYIHQKNNLAISSRNFRIYEQRNIDINNKLMKETTSENGKILFKKEKAHYDEKNKVWHHTTPVPANTLGTMSSPLIKLEGKPEDPIDPTTTVRPRLIRPLSSLTVKKNHFNSRSRPQSPSSFVLTFHNFTPSMVVGQRSEEPPF